MRGGIWADPVGRRGIRSWRQGGELGFEEGEGGEELGEEAAGHGHIVHGKGEEGESFFEKTLAFWESADMIMIWANHRKRNSMDGPKWK